MEILTKEGIGNIRLTVTGTHETRLKFPAIPVGAIKDEKETERIIKFAEIISNDLINVKKINKSFRGKISYTAENVLKCYMQSDSKNEAFPYTEEE